MLDLTPRLADPVVRGLPALAIGCPNGAKVDEVCKRYLQEPERVLLGYEVGRVLLGCVGNVIRASGHEVIAGAET